MGVVFKKDKNASEPNFIIPSKLAQTLNIRAISESGICFYGNNVYSKAYYVSDATKDKASANEKTRGLTMVLRKYDIRYLYMEYATGEVLLSVEIEGKDFNEAKGIIEQLENTIHTDLYTFGIVIEPLNLQERIGIMYEQVMKANNNDRMDIKDYLSNSSWLNEFDYRKHKVLSERNGLKAPGGEKSYLYVRRMPSENLNEVYLALRECEEVGDIAIEYEAVSDLDVAYKIMDIYDDVTVPVAEDSRKYVMVGIYFSIVGNENVSWNLYKELDKKLSPYGCELSFFFYKHIEALSAFISLNTNKIRQLRMVKVANVVKINPFSETKVDDKDAFLNEFDDMLKGGGL